MQNIVNRDPARMAAVRRSGLLDTPAEECFDRLTRLAAESLGAPAAFLSIVDECSDFYKSVFGFSEALAASRRLSGETFCHHAIVAEGLLVIDDARASAIYRSVPTVESMGVVAYLGIPLHTPDEQALGAFCVIDTKPRRWTRRDVMTACVLARAGLREIEARYPAGVNGAGISAATRNLSAREREVMLRIVAGQRIKEIALDLNLSEKTIATHRQRLLKKLGLADNRALYRHALRHGLLDWSEANERRPRGQPVQVETRM